MEKIPCANLLRKLKTFEDRVNISFELGKKLNIIFRLFLPKEQGFDVKFFLSFLKDEKKVI